MWGVAQLKPQKNALVLATANLERQGFTTFNPTFEAPTIWRGKPRLEQQQVFPGYIFVGIANNQMWMPIRSTYGVNRLLVRKASGSEYDEPAPISDDFVAQLRGCCCERHDGKSEVTLLQPGTQVHITAGPFAGRDALVTWASAERVRLLVWLMGRDVAVTVAVADVAAQT